MTSNKSGFRILVVDDETELASLVAENLETQGYSTVLAHSRKETLDTLKQGKFHAIVSDLRLPDGSGGSVLEDMKAGAVPQIPVIFVTGYISGTEFQELGDEEMILHKPINFKVLYHLLEKIREDFFSAANPYLHSPDPITATSRPSMEIVIHVEKKANGGEKLPATLISFEGEELALEMKPGSLQAGEALWVHVESRHSDDDVQFKLAGSVAQIEALGATEQLLTVKLSEGAEGAPLERLSALIARQQQYILDFLSAAKGQ